MQGVAQLFQHGVHLPVLELVAGLVGDEPSRDGHELGDHLQAVLPQGGAGLHDVHNDIRKPKDGCQLNGAVQLDDIDIPPHGGVVALCNVDELGGHPHRAAGVVPVARRGGYAHPAAAKAGVQQLVHIGGGFGQDILANDAHIGSAVLHIDGHVAGLDQKIPDARCRVFHHQLAGGVVVLRAAVADARQQIVDLVAQPPFGQRHVQHHLAGVLMLYRRHRVQPVQLVQIHRKADGTRPGGEFLQQ